MLDLLVKSAVRRKIIALFTLNPTLEFYARQVAKEIGESPHAAGLELNYLVKGEILKVCCEDKKKFYKLNEKYSFVAMLKSVVEKMRNEGNKEICSIPDLLQRKRIKENLNRVLEDVKKYYNPDKVILFGSAASGKIGPCSDIDLVIVKDTMVPFFKRAKQLVELLDYDVDIDFLIYTSDEFAFAAKENLFFQREVLKRGKVLYEKAA